MNVELTAANIYNVKDYGASGTFYQDTLSYGDDSVGIQAAVNAANTAGGGIVWIPTGYYLLRTKLQLSSAVCLAGVGCEVPHKGTAQRDHSAAFPVRHNDGTPLLGSWLMFRDPIGAPAIIVNGNGTVIRDLGFCHNQPTVGGAWMPSLHDFVFDIAATDVLLTNLFFLNPTNAIRIPLGQRIAIDRIFGQPLQIGILVEKCVDPARFNDIAFWPFWRDDVAVIAWQQAHGVGIRSLWNDNPHFSHLHIFGYEVGLHIGSSTDGTTRAFRVTDTDTDECRIGLLVDGLHTTWPVTGQVVNFTAGGFMDSNPENVGIAISNENIRLQLTNIALSHFGGAGIWIWATQSTIITIDNIRIYNWNRANSGKSGIASPPGARIMIGYCQLFENGNCAPSFTGANITSALPRIASVPG